MCDNLDPWKIYFPIQYTTCPYHSFALGWKDDAEEPAWPDRILGRVNLSWAHPMFEQRNVLIILTSKFGYFGCVPTTRPITLKWILWGLWVLIEIVFSCLYVKFEPFLYSKKFGDSPLKFGPVGAGSLGWGRLAGFLSGVSTFFAI